MEVKPTKPQLGQSQYLATVRMMQISNGFKLGGTKAEPCPYWMKIWDACQREAYGRLAVSCAGGNPDAVKVYAVWNENAPLVYRSIDPPGQRIVMVRLNRKPTLDIVGWTTGKLVMSFGRCVETMGAGCVIPGYAIEAAGLQPVTSVTDLAPLE